MEWSNYRKKQLFLISGTFFILVFMVYRFWHGENSFFRIHDYGEQYVALFSIMSLSDFFGFERFFDPFLGGIERNALGSEFNIGNIIHVIFPAFIAIIINELIIRIVAFCGLYLFFENAIKLNQPLISCLISLTFAALPFFPPIYLTIAGLPLIAWALIKITNQEANFKTYLLCFLFPLYIAIQGLPGVLLFLSSILCAYGLIEKKFSRHAFLIFIAIGMICILSEWRMLTLTYLDASFTTHRVEKLRSYIDPNIPNYFSAVWQNMRYGITKDDLVHSPSYHLSVLLQVIVFSISIALFDFKAKSNIQKLRRWLIIILLIFLLSILMRLGCFFLQPYFSIFKQFNFERIIWMYPTLIYITFGISITYLISRLNKSWLKTILILLILTNCINTIIVAYNPKTFPLANLNGMTYRDFYAKPIFKKIHLYLENKPVNRVASIGLYPAVTLFNGFRTADGYWMNYNLKYKKRFFPVIDDELAKNSILKTYYEDWGHRVYLYYHGQGLVRWQKPLPTKPKDFFYNTEALKNLDVSHIFSTIKVKNHHSLGWRYEKDFCDTSIPYCIHLYSL